MGAISSIAIITAIIVFVARRTLNLGQLTYSSTSDVYFDNISQLITGRDAYFDLGIIGRDKTTGSYVHLDERMIQITASQVLIDGHSQMIQFSECNYSQNFFNAQNKDKYTVGNSQCIDSSSIYFDIAGNSHNLELKIHMCEEQ